MADQIYKVRDPSGAIREIRGPAGASDDEVIAQAKALFGGETPTKPAPKSASQKQQFEETADELPLWKQIAAGAGGAVKGMQLGAKQLLGMDVPADELASYQAAMAGLRGTAGGVGGELAANILPGLGVMGAASKIPRIAGLMTAGGAKGAATIAGLGAATGAGEGALIPVADSGDRLTNTLLSGTIGAVAPTVTGGLVKVGQYVKGRAAPMFSKEAQQVAGGRLLNEATGEKAADVIAELRNPLNQAVVSGQTAGQAAIGAGSPEFSAMQKIVTDFNPQAGFAKEQGQKEARQQLIQSVGKTEKELADAIVKRDTDANLNYAKAFASSIKADNELGRILKNPYVADTIPELRNLVLAQTQKTGARMPLGEQLQIIKKQLDAKMTGSPLGKPSDDVARAIAEVQDDLVAWMTKKIPGYDFAKAEYAKASFPITEMRIGQKAADLLDPALGSKERGAVLAKALDDELALLKKSGGFTRKELSAQMQPQNLSKLEKVVKELDINADFAEQASRGMGSEAVKSAVGQSIDLPHLLNNGVVIANNVLRRVVGGGSVKTLKELAVTMQDPKLTAVMMEAASEQEKNALKFLMKAQQRGAIAGVAVTNPALE